MNQIIFNYLNGFAGQNLSWDIIIIFCAQHLILVLAIAFTLFNLYRFFYPKKGEESFQYFRTIYIVLISSFVIWIVSQIINFFYFSPRPFLALDNVNLLFEHGANDSFPSGHSTFIFTLAFMSYYYGRKLFTPLLIGAFVVGISRVMVGIHWPTDILGAIILSFFGAYIINFIIVKFNL